MTGIAPVVYLAFNRPECVQRSFPAIQAQRPARLFLVADGPRATHPADAGLCAEVRRQLEAVDWPCETTRIYADSNLGLKARVSSALDQVFGQVEQAIVLEDDCVPHSDFFSFCTSLLDRHRDDDRVFAITGDNFQDGQPRGPAAYYFSKYLHCWGWASWRRSWSQYRGDLDFWPVFRASADWRSRMPDSRERAYWEAILDRAWRGELQSWAYPFAAAAWRRGGLVATPNANLVSNIGFGEGGTNALDSESGLARLETCSLGSLEARPAICQDVEADRYTFDHAFGGRAVRGPKYWLRQLRGLASGLTRRTGRSNGT